MVIKFTHSQICYNVDIMIMMYVEMITMITILEIW